MVLQKINTISTILITYLVESRRVKKNRLALYTYKAHGVAVPCNLLLAVFTAYTFYRMAHYITFLLMVSMFFKLSKKCIVSGRYSISPGVLFTKLTGSIQPIIFSMLGHLWVLTSTCPLQAQLPALKCDINRTIFRVASFTIYFQLQIFETQRNVMNFSNLTTRVYKYTVIHEILRAYVLRLSARINN